ncbi:hypothetical protein [Prosthecobacter sp.]|uniref:hypothetical protein n=1 Tax=Prosthecobacter sp. TaxID=1965333 RepID=UPI003782EBB7
MKVEIRVYDNDPQGTLCCTWTLDRNGHAVCDDPKTQERVEYSGICAKGRLYFPKDGEEFLRNYQWEYASSSFVRAVIVE